MDVGRGREFAMLNTQSNAWLAKFLNRLSHKIIKFQISLEKDLSICKKNQAKHYVEYGMMFERFEWCTWFTRTVEAAPEKPANHREAHVMCTRAGKLTISEEC